MAETRFVQRRDLMTAVVSLDYHFPTRTGRLVMPPYCCTDMFGCIRLFEAIDPDVKRIVTVAGDELDTSYVLTSTGWCAHQATGWRAARQGAKALAEQQ